MGCVVRVTRSVGACTRRIFPPCSSLKSSGVQSAETVLSRKIDDGIVPFDNYPHASFLIARAK
ncbi:hypothetical protein KAU37_06490, partial [Candidatus Bipolaricaulota bacterium]|nr:hypothetical protein [Candidatus Bipolaricaulota bacterium]